MGMGEKYYMKIFVFFQPIIIFWLEVLDIFEIDNYSQINLHFWVQKYMMFCDIINVFNLLQ